MMTAVFGTSIMMTAVFGTSIREAIGYQIGCFFTHCVKGGGSKPCVKIYVVDFYNSGGLLTT